jgi:hypothetical protein
MKGETVAGLVIALAVALVAALGLVAWLIGAQTLRVMALVLVSGLVVVGLLLGAAAVVRAWRKNDAPPIERQVIREVRIIDRAAQPQLPSVPPFGVFPELLRASYRAGLLSGQDGSADVVDGEAHHLHPDGQSWSGDIMP